MPGLSNDPAKRSRQLDGLHAGRRALALKQLGIAPEDAPPDKGRPPEPEPPATAPAAPPEPEPTRTAAAEHQGATGGALGVPVHTYAPPAPEPEPVPEPAAVPVAEDPNHADHTSARPRRGPLGAFFDGLRDT